ncbi:LysR family transcriptional regulator [Rhodanobacter sp. AS-Z3]|uniref:LysR family transcriptional regulator n=1 Tax=Rhodanobacter sp. AS-Z3 TaxID=3031330 RepID=UPI00247B0F16|nr:LysR family transcriptional regulator [Rhodanobacter sp. AS-Z3]WEN14148.1 LysR family transcriptional regulator [Rhodanobacter sp. AS-Z3]
MDLRQLRYFLALVEYGSFTRAAAMTGRTQQALSKGIQALEHSLGTRVVERGTHGVRLTSAGRLLLDHARIADEAVRSFEERLQELQTGTEGEVRIGVAPTGASALVAPAVLALRQQWPDIGVRVIGGILPDLLPALLAREVDVVVALDTVSEPDPQVIRDVLMQDEYRIMAGARHPLAGRRVNSVDLLQYPWIVGRRLGSVEVEFRQRFVEAGLTAPASVIESSSAEFLRALVSADHYLTLLPSLLVHDELRSGQWVRLNAPGFSWQRPLIACTRQGEPQSTPVLRLLQALHNAAASLRQTGQAGDEPNND